MANKHAVTRLWRCPGGLHLYMHKFSGNRYTVRTESCLKPLVVELARKL